MEQANALKQAESALAIASDRISVMQGKLEDIVFRAQRIANARKNQMPVMDTMFGSDLQSYRREVRRMALDVSTLPNMVSAIEREARPAEADVRAAQAVQRNCQRVSNGLKALRDHAALAHQHIRESDHKIEAWYLLQEIEQMTEKGQTLPYAASRLLLRVGASQDDHGAAA